MNPAASGPGRPGLLAALLLVIALPTPGRTAVATELPVRLLFGLNGPAPGSPFRTPEALLIDAGSRALYIADSGARQVAVCSLQGVPGLPLEAGPNFQPISLAMMQDGRLLVSDAATGGIKVFSQSGKLQAELNLPQLSGLDGVRAGRIVLDRKGRLYCVDTAHGEVLVFDFPWKLKLRLGARGSRDAFKVPEDVAVDRFGRIYVSDSVGVPIRVFDSGGAYLFSIGRHGEGASDLSSPTSLLMDRFDQLWVTDTLRNQIVIYSHTGWPLRVFGQVGQLSGQLLHPVALALDGLGRIYIAEREGRRVQCFSYDNPLDEFSK